MMPLNEVLIQFAVVGGLLAGEVVGNVSLLKQDVAVIFLVVQDLTNGFNMPHGIPSGRGDPVFFQFRRDRAKRQAISVPGEYRPDDLGACRVGDEFSVLVMRVSVAHTIREAGTALNKPCLKTPPDVVALILTFVLIETRVYGQQLYRIRIVDMELFNFKVHVDPESVQFGAGVEQLNRVAAEPTDGLYQDQVYLSVAAVLHHPLKVFHLLVVPSGRLVGIYAGKDPVRFLRDRFVEIRLLHFKAAFLYLLLCADPTVGRHLF